MSNHSKNSLLKQVPVLPKFEGKFFQWEQVFYTNREKGTSARFLVFSSGKRGTVFKYLWLKLLWDELSRLEFEYFISIPQTLQDPKVFAFLQARLVVPKAILRERINAFEKLIEGKVSSRESYLGYKRMYLEVHRIERKLPKISKFSGYVKSPSSVGSKFFSKVQLPEPTAPTEDNFEKVIDWYRLLTVGEIPLLGGYTPLMML